MELIDGYHWFKALHIISVIAWMAGLLYLPRLYVYHCGAEAGSEHAETLKVMERRLLRAIMNPAMISTYIFGILLLMSLGSQVWSQGWWHGKALMILVLTVSHGMQAKWRKDFEADRNTRSHKFYRVMNEVPTLAMIILVILVVVKPF